MKAPKGKPLPFADSPPELGELVDELAREAGMRRRVYPKMVADGRMTQADADRKILLMDYAYQRERSNLIATEVTAGHQEKKRRADITSMPGFD